MTPGITLLHNPRCSKSRAALELLLAHGANPSIVEYLKTPPTGDQLREILAKLRMKPGDLVRKGEEICKTLYKGRTMGDDDWIRAMEDNPVLIERPIAIRGDMAVVGRPPERVLELLAPDQAA